MTVAEGAGLVRDAVPGKAASMGPQLDSCGRRVCRSTQSACVLASMGPQLDSCGRQVPRPQAAEPGLLQWGRNLTVAEGFVAEGRKSLGIKLQWGRNLTVAEGGGLGGHALAGRPASMGPQLDSCGRLSEFLARLADQNPLQWGRNLTVAEGLEGKEPVGCRGAWLQWGRNLTVAEGTTECTAILSRQRASMGPQLDSCGRYAGVAAACGDHDASTCRRVLPVFLGDYGYRPPKLYSQVDKVDKICQLEGPFVPLWATPTPFGRRMVPAWRACLPRRQLSLSRKPYARIGPGGGLTGRMIELNRRAPRTGRVGDGP